jgi:hypothetical protein
MFRLLRIGRAERSFVAAGGTELHLQACHSVREHAATSAPIVPDRQVQWCGCAIAARKTGTGKLCATHKVLIDSHSNETGNRERRYGGNRKCFSVFKTYCPFASAEFPVALPALRQPDGRQGGNACTARRQHRVQRSGRHHLRVRAMRHHAHTHGARVSSASPSKGS